MDFRTFFAVEDNWFEEDKDMVEYEGKPTLTPPVIPQDDIIIECEWRIEF